MRLWFLLLRLAVLSRLVAVEPIGRPHMGVRPRAQLGVRPRPPALAQLDVGVLERPMGPASADMERPEPSAVEQLGVAGWHQIQEVVERRDRYGRIVERFCGECGLLLVERPGSRAAAVGIITTRSPEPSDLVHVPDESVLRRVWFAPGITLACLPLVASFDLASAAGLLIGGTLVTAGALVYFGWRPMAAVRLAAFHRDGHPRNARLERLSSLFHPWRR